MKRILTVIAVAMSLVFATGALASDQTKSDGGKDKKALAAEKKKAVAAEKARKAQMQAAEKQNKVLLTGSYIPQTIRKNERITDGVNQVVVVDQNIIQNTGASDLRQLLIRQGAH